MAYYKIVLDVNKRKVIHNQVFARSYDDNASVVVATIVEDGNPLSLSGKTITFECLTPGDGAIQLPVDASMITDNIISYPIPEDALINSGVISVAYFAIEGNGVRTSSQSFSIIVEKSMHEGIDVGQVIGDWEKIKQQIIKEWEEIKESIVLDGDYWSIGANRRQIPTGTDLNTLRLTENYTVLEDSDVSSMSNLPEGVDVAFNLTVTSYQNDTDSLHQELSTRTGSDYFRTTSDGGSTWDAWQAKGADMSGLYYALARSARTVLSNSANLNTITDPGNYLCNSDTASQITNKPVRLASDFILTVTQGANDCLYQKIISRYVGNEYTRMSINGGTAWNPWIQDGFGSASIIQSTNLDTLVNPGIYSPISETAANGSTGKPDDVTGIYTLEVLPLTNNVNGAGIYQLLTANLDTKHTRYYRQSTNGGASWTDWDYADWVHGSTIEEAQESLNIGSSIYSPAPVTTSGSGDAYEISVPEWDDIDTIPIGSSINVIFHTQSTSTTPTISINGLSPERITLAHGQATSSTPAFPSQSLIRANTSSIIIKKDSSSWILLSAVGVPFGASLVANPWNGSAIQNTYMLAGRTALTTGQDLNTLITTGNWVASTSDIANSIVNKPSGVVGTFVVTNATIFSGTVYQKLETISGGTYIRIYTASTSSWSSWSDPSGSLLRVPIAESDDLNDYTSFGNYAAYSNAIAQSVENSPVQVAFILDVYSSTGSADGGFIAQELRPYNNGSIFYRRSDNNGSTWSNWQNLTAAGSIATVDVAGLVKPDGTSITVDADGTIRANADGDASGFYNPKPVVTTGSGAAYEASIEEWENILTYDDITGIEFTIIAHTASTSRTCTISINGLGAIRIVLPGTVSSSYAQTFPVASFLSSNRPINIMYQGTYFIVTSFGAEPYGGSLVTNNWNGDSVSVATLDVRGTVKPDGTSITVDEDGTIRASASGSDGSGFYNPKPVTTTGSGSQYAVTVEEWEEIEEPFIGAKLTIIPHANSTSASATLNVNGWGAVRMYLPLSENTLTGAQFVANNVLRVDTAAELIWNGSIWIITSLAGRPYGGTNVANPWAGAAMATATSTVKGAVKPDNKNIQVATDGTLSLNGVPLLVDGIDVPDGSNLNDEYFCQAGTYTRLTASGESVENAPFTDPGFQMLTINTSALGGFACEQIAIPFGSSGIVGRNTTNYNDDSLWSSWQRLSWANGKTVADARTNLGVSSTAEMNTAISTALTGTWTAISNANLTNAKYKIVGDIVYLFIQSSESIAAGKQLTINPFPTAIRSTFDIDITCGNRLVMSIVGGTSIMTILNTGASATRANGILVSYHRG